MTLKILIQSIFFFFQGAISHYCQIANKHLYQMVDFARRLPHFGGLPAEDQVLLIRSGWNELLIASVAYLSIEVCFISIG